MKPESKRNPVDYLKIFFRRKWLIIIPTVIAIMISIVTANMLPKIYEASTLILVEEGRVINPLIQGLAVSTSIAQRLTILREQIAGWDRINQLIKKLNLAKDIKTQQEYEALVLRLRKNINVRLHGQNIISISYQGQSPVDSMNIVKNITDIFIAENLKQQNSETENAIAFINDQLALYQKKLKQGEISAMEEKLNTLLADSTEAHPMVIDLRKKIEIAKDELSEGNYKVEASASAKSSVELAALEKELVTLETDMAGNTGEDGENRIMLSNKTDDKLYKLLLLDKVSKVAERDTNVNQALYNELLKRLETAKITQRLEASKDGTRYTILDPTRLPLKPVKPNKLLVLLMGIFIGICCGIGLVSAAEVFDHSFLGTDDLLAYLELPLIGAISKIITQSDVQAQKARNIRITCLSVITSLVLAIVIIFNVLIKG